jgi:2-oxoglutarate ferredoxin oxidoreductase subunit alpha
VIRFAGDSGDGMQVTGSQFTLETALAGSDFSTFPDFPAEIRAPAGTTFGVSAFQIHFGGTDVMTPGDAVDVLVAMNPAALTTEVKDLKVGGAVIVDTAAFNERNLGKAGYTRNPLDDDSLARYQVLKFDITKLTADAVKPHGLSSREAHLCRNMWALGLLLWMYGYERTATIEWLNRKFAKKPTIAAANIAALNAGHAFGETAEMTEHLACYTVPKAEAKAGRYRTVSGTRGSGGLVAGSAPAASRNGLADIPSHPRRPCGRSPTCALTASSHSRPRTRSPRVAPRWVHPTPVRSGSRRARDRALP